MTDVEQRMPGILVSSGRRKGRGGLFHQAERQVEHCHHHRRRRRRHHHHCVVVIIIIITRQRDMLNIGCSAKQHNSLKCLCQGSQDSSGPPRVKSKLDVEDDELGVDAMAHFCSPQRSFREKITDFFTAYDDANADREGSVSPPMPVLTPQVLRKNKVL